MSYILVDYLETEFIDGCSRNRLSEMLLFILYLKVRDEVVKKKIQLKSFKMKVYSETLSGKAFVSHTV